MTLTDLAGALLRRWPIVLCGVLLTLGFAFLATRSEPVFHARSEVVFLAPASASNPNELVTSSESIIITAGAVMKRINGADAVLQFNDQSVNPVGAPKSQGSTWIRLVDAGNQWVSNFDDQVLVVDAVGSTREEAETRVLVAAEQIRDVLTSLQTDERVDPINDISTRLSPEAPVVAEIDGSGLRAAGMTLILGLIATVALVVVLEVSARGNREPSHTRGGTRSGRRGTLPPHQHPSGADGTALQQAAGL